MAKGFMAVAIFFLLITGPIWYTALCGEKVAAKKAQLAQKESEGGLSAIAPASANTKVSACTVNIGPQLVIDRSIAGDKCIESEEFMRRNHMVFLKHRRDETVRYGLRNEANNFLSCRKCHPKREEFCDRCHTYAAVSLDCFGCHNYN